MTVLTLRRVRDHFVLTGPDIEPQDVQNAGPGAGLVLCSIFGAHRSAKRVPAAPPRDARRQRLTKTARAMTDAGMQAEDDAE